MTKDRLAALHAVSRTGRARSRQKGPRCPAHVKLTIDNEQSFNCPTFFWKIDGLKEE